MSKSFEFSRMGSAAAEDVWAIWSQVATWNRWDHDLEFSELNGEFVQGANGILKPVDGPKVNFVISKCRKNELFTTESSLPLCKMSVAHTVQQVDDQQVQITHRVEFAGPLSFLFRRVIGRKIEKDLPDTLANLMKIAETESAKNGLRQNV